MTTILDAIKKGEVSKVKDLIAKGVDLNAVRSDGLSLIHVAATSSNAEILEMILKQYNAQCEIKDNDGNTPLHLASKSNRVEAVKILLNFGADSNATNNLGKKPTDMTKDSEILTLLKAANSAAIETGSIHQARVEMLRQIESELPDDMPSLKSFTLELLLSNQLFQERCKETLHQLIEEKHIALHKYRLLENAAGIRDRETGHNFLSQLQYLQLENEQQAATIAYLKIQNRMLETSVTQQEEYYRKNLSEMSDQHGQEIKIMMERVAETETRFMEMQKVSGDELSALRKENGEIKAKTLMGRNSSIPAGDVQFMQSVQNENVILQQKIKELQVERVAIGERLKSTEQLKTLHEQEITKVRNDMNLLRKIMQEAMTKVLTETKAETDERDETSGQIVFVRGENGSKQIKGATSEKLVERLTDPSTYDSQFQAAFLLTFRSFSDANTILGFMIKRYKESMVDSPSITSIQSQQSPVQLRVCNTIKTWIENYWFDFQDDKAILDKLNEFIEFINRHNSKLANVIKVPLSRKMAGRDEPTGNTVALEKKNSQPKPKPILPKGIAKRTSNAASDLEKQSTLSLNGVKNDKQSSIANWVGFGKLKISEERSEDLKLKLTDLEPLEIARQLTIVEYELFTAVKPTEFLDQAWMKNDREIRAPNICNMTKWSNHVTHWIISEIITVKDLKARALIYERAVAIAQHLEKMNNFNGVKEVLAALQSSAVYRLKRTREAVNSKYLKVYEDLVKLTSSDLNFKNLRAKIHAADPPLIPFPGIYQGDLVFLDTCSRSKLENGLVNFLKYQKIASYILELQVYQQTPYNLEYVSELSDYVRNFGVLDENEAYNESLICEPRGS